MSVTALLTTAATLRRVSRATTDAEGNPVRTATTRAVMVHLEQSGGSGRTGSGEQQGDHLDVQTRWRVFFAAGTDVGPLDELVIERAPDDELVLAIDGDPWEVVNPRRRTVSHIEAWAITREQR